MAEISIPGYAAISANSGVTAFLSDSLTKYRQDGEDGTTGSTTLAIKQARNEISSFQVLIYGNGALSNVDVTVSAFTKGSDVIEDIYLYKQSYIDVITSERSRDDYLAGSYPDALLPKVDRYFSETRNTFPFSVANGKVQGVWVDVGTEVGTPAGTYTATVTVSMDGVSDQTLTVSLEVYDFSLSATPYFPSLFNLSHADLNYGHGGISDGSDSGRLSYLDDISKTYQKALVYHRMGSTYVEAEVPAYTWTSPTLTVTDSGYWQTVYQDVMDGNAIVSGPNAGGRMKSIAVPYPWIADNDGSVSVGDRETFDRQWLQHFYDLADVQSWTPFETLHVETPYDEPNGTSHSWRGSTITDYAANIDAADDVNIVNTGGLGTWKTIYVHKHNLTELAGFEGKGIFDPQMDHYSAAGWEKDNTSSTYYYPLSGYTDTPWGYLSCAMSGCGILGGSFYYPQPDLSIDAPYLTNRLWGVFGGKIGLGGFYYWFLCFANSAKEGLTGEPYVDQHTWTFGAQGDGHLIYPGIADKTGLSAPASTPEIGGTNDIPVESVRMKAVRDAMNDMEYIARARAVNSATTDTYVDTMFSDATLSTCWWDINYVAATLKTMRDNLAALIESGYSQDTGSVVAATSTQDGDWNDTLTWVGGVVPGSGGSATLNHIVTVSDTRTVGNNTNSITINNGGQLILSGVLTCNGDITLSGKIRQQAGSSITFNGNYDLTFSGDTGEYHSYGTALNRCTLEAAATYGWSLQAGVNDLVTFKPKYTNITRFGRANSTGNHALEVASNGEASLIELENCLIDDYWRLLFGSGGSPAAAATYKWTNCDFRNPNYERIWEYTDTTEFTAGTRGTWNCTFVGDATNNQFYVWHDSATSSLTVSGCIGEDVWWHNIGGGAVEWDVVSRYVNYTGGNTDMTNDTSPGGWTVADSVIVADRVNAHVMSMGNGSAGAPSATCMFEDNIIFTPNSTANNSANLILFSRAATIQRNITIGGNGVGSTSGNSGVVLVDRHTHIHKTTDNYDALLLQETNAYTANQITLRNSLLDGINNAGEHGVQAESPLTQDYAYLDYNNWYQIADHYQSCTVANDTLTEGVSTGFGGNDLTLDPQLNNRDADLSTWDSSLGGAGTVTNAFAEMLKVNGFDRSGTVAIFDTNYTKAALLTYLRSAFTPTNISLRGAGLAGVDIGARDI